MSIAIPNLDIMNFEELVKEAKSLIPIYNPEWTNHNPSDPGITLIELFSWLCEMMIYRIDQVPDENYIHFLNLLGIKLDDDEKLESGIRRGVKQLSECTRAITAEDFEKLAYQAVMGKPGLKESFPEISVRTICYTNSDLENKTDTYQKFGHNSIILVTNVIDKMKFLKEHSDIRSYVRDYLSERKLITNRIHVVDPDYKEIRINLQVASNDAQISDTIRKVIEDYLDPINGGLDKRGWPLGRNFYSSDLYCLVEGIAGVDHVVRLELDSPALMPYQLVKLKSLDIEVEG